MENSITLDDVELSIQALQAHQAFSTSLMVVLVQVGLDPQDIPDEQVGIDDNGSLKIWIEGVTIEDPSDGVKNQPQLTVPASEWQWKVGE